VTTEESLVEYFSQYGAVADAKVIRDGEKSKGFAFVQFVDPTPPKVLESVHFIDQRRCGVGLALQRQR
jgi:RNA recognition motif-containing protein